MKRSSPDSASRGEVWFHLSHRSVGAASFIRLGKSRKSMVLIGVYILLGLSVLLAWWAFNDGGFDPPKPPT